MGDKRGLGKQASLRAFKPLLGTAASDEFIAVALDDLIARLVVSIGGGAFVATPTR